MNPSIRALALGIALTAALAPLVHAGGAGVTVERQGDGRHECDQKLAANTK